MEPAKVKKDQLTFGLLFMNYLYAIIWQYQPKAVGMAKS